MKICEYFEVKVRALHAYKLCIDYVSIALFLARFPADPRNTPQNEESAQSIFAS
jgi:hypothetical protein